MDVLVIGDSIVHGGLDSEMGGWVARLKVHSMQKQLGDHVFGLGIGGNSTRNLLERAEVEILARQNHVKSIIFGTGTNDMNQGIGLIEYRESLGKLMAMAEKVDKKVYLMGMFLWVKDGQVVDSSAYDNAIKELCSNHGHTYIQTNDLILSEDLVDGCHPNAGGHQKICNRVVKILSKGK